MQGHRKQLRRFHEPGDVHELTFSNYRQLELLTRDDWRQMLCQSIDRAIANHKYRLVAFVLMTNHVHLLVFPTEVRPGELPDLDVLLSAIKRPFSYRVKQMLIAEKSPLLHELTVLERPGKPAFRFWQEGAGYDRNLRTEKSLLGSIDYIHANPVRAGLVARPGEWKWSSARWYESDKRIVDPELPTIHGLPPEAFG
ncbi:Transposase IS200 like protein [Caulifigura coniformis]|uniref:Transposase IS200 like protein n=1 Tax=Caulifigura coniformis TaxID=2527983 RepID=A0A517SDI8_9PLAN|nr:transposase [Caulifigura coniformis]QDT54188.1 Transposase IS200 like protein [Caulifigura coniformis]